MPKGLKQSSSVVSIGFGVDESAANTFTQSSVDLNLSPLDREVFVVLAVNLDPFTPDAIDKTDTNVQCSLTTTSQTNVQNLSNANCIAASGNFIKAVSASGIAVSFQTGAFESPPSTLDYIGIIATTDICRAPAKRERNKRRIASALKKLPRAPPQVGVLGKLYNTLREAPEPLLDATGIGFQNEVLLRLAAGQELLNENNMTRTTRSTIEELRPDN